MRSIPRPKVSRASRRTSHPPREKPYPTRRDVYVEKKMPPLNPPPVEFLAEAECAPNLPYFITRTRNQELPVYHDRKRGGNLLVTYIKKVDGSLVALRNTIRDLLNVPEENVVMNERTRQVVIKGHYKQTIEKFLRERRF